MKLFIVVILLSGCSEYRCYSDGLYKNKEGTIWEKVNDGCLDDDYGRFDKPDVAMQKIVEREQGIRDLRSELYGCSRELIMIQTKAKK